MWKALQDVDDCFTVNLAEPWSKDTLDDSLLMRRATRTGPQIVVHANQLIPVLSSLAIEALHTSVIRQELDDGWALLVRTICSGLILTDLPCYSMKETIRLNKEKFSELNREMDRWAELRNDLQSQKAVDHSATEKVSTPIPPDIHIVPHRITLIQLRVAREVHNSTLTKLRVHHNTILQSHLLRFGPLGTDDEGRIYYALSHPTTPPSKNKRKLLAERDSLDNWAYFVFVWGKRPADASDDGNDDDDDDNMERWWAFNTPKSVRALSKWLTMRATEKDEQVNASVQTTRQEHLSISSTKGSVSLSSPPPMEPLIPTPPSRSSNSTYTTTSIPSTTAKLPSPNLHAVRDLCRGLNDFADFLEVHSTID